MTEQTDVPMLIDKMNNIRNVLYKKIKEKREIEKEIAIYEDKINEYKKELYAKCQHVWTYIDTGGNSCEPAIYICIKCNNYK